MITALQCVETCQALYSGSAFDRLFTFDSVVVGVQFMPDNQDLVVFRGSVTPEDWLRDADAVPSWDDTLGYCHAGFLEGVHDVYQEIVGAVRPGASVTFTGHSLGGARARLVAALFAANALPVAQLVVFGSPRPAFRKVSDIINKPGAMKHSSYRNRQDVVPTMPPGWIGYVHPDIAIAIDSGAPIDGELFEGPEDHHIALYVRAIRLLPQSN